MSTKAEIVLSAKDETQAAFNTVNANLSKIAGTGINLQDSFKGAVLAMTGLAGVGSLAVLKGKIDDAIGGMAGLKDAAERTGSSVENLSALKAVAKVGGHDFEQIEAAIVKLNKALHGTDDESKGAGKALAAVGLNIKALREEDPAAAVLDIAKAFDKFADGGGKSAAAVAIFGKAGAQLLPFLKDLAEQQELVGKVTAEQAEMADRYEKNLNRLSAQFGNASKAIAGALLPTMAQLSNEFTSGTKNGNSMADMLGGGLKVALETVAVLGVNVAFVFKTLGSEIGGTAAQAAAIAKLDFKGAKFIGEAMREDAAKARAELDSLEKRIMTPMRLPPDAPKSTALNKQNFGNDGSTGIGRTEADPAATLIANLDKKLAVMALDMQATGKLTEAEKELIGVQQQLDAGTIKATARQKELILGKAEALVAYDKVNRAMEVEAAAADQAQQQLGAWFDSLDEQARSLEKQADLYGLTAAQIAVVTQARLEDALAQAKEEGAGEDQIAVLERELDARKRITDAQIRMAEKQQLIDEQAKKTNDTLEEFSKQAARNIQDAMADFLFDPFAKGTQGMLQSFGTMLQKMIAQAVAADLGKRMFGDLVKGGEGSGWFGGALDWLGGLIKNADGGVYASAGLAAYSGRIVDRPTVFPFARGVGLMGEAGPEAILPLKRGSDGRLGVASGGGGGHTINVYVTGTNAPDVRRSAGQGAREALSALNGARRYG